MSQLHLVDIKGCSREGRARRAAHRRPARVLGLLIDAGCCGYRMYSCRRCRLEWRLFVTKAEDARRRLVLRRPCPACNSREVLDAWGQADELQEVLAKLERDAEAAR